ncbi:hypothetical protein M0813_02020 [Anaeramoeba flamelloides]|uniref:Uncharacterized protein n=1 Tax=Anaeramoeba flamelloides TaxID=1746091 RepID=A0ABQ8YQ75_9EUKA|nr:hypothetical protein M0813_02020 [Anaeramoeba flamelloides]
MDTSQKTRNKTLSNVEQTKGKITQNGFIGPFHYSELTLSSLCEIVGEKSRNCSEFLFFIPGYCLTFENEQVKNRWVWNWNTYYSSNSDLVAFLIHSSTFIPNKTAVNPLGLLVTICFIDVKPPSYAMKRKNGIRSRYSSKLKGTCFFAKSVEIINDQEKVPSTFWTVPQLREFIHQNKQNGKILEHSQNNPNMGNLHDSSASVQNQTQKITRKTRSQKNKKYVIQSKQFRIKVGKNLEEDEENEDEDEEEDEDEDEEDEGEDEEEEQDEEEEEGDEEEDKEEEDGQKKNLKFKRNKKNTLKKKSKKLYSQNHNHHRHRKRHHNKNNKNKNKNHKNKKKINDLRILNRKRKHKKFKRSTKMKNQYSSNSSSNEESGSNSNSQSQISDLQTKNKSGIINTDTYSNIESESSLSSPSANSYLNSSSYSNLNSESNSILETESESESDFGLDLHQKKTQKKRKKKQKHKHKSKYKQKHKQKQKQKNKQKHKQKEKHKHKQGLNKLKKKKRYRKKKIKREKQKKKKKKTNRVQITNSVSLPNLVLLQQNDEGILNEKAQLKNKSKKNKDDENQFYNSDPEIQEEIHETQNNFCSFLKNSKHFIKQNKSKAKSKNRGKGNGHPNQEQLDHFMRKKSILLSIWEKCGSEQFLKTDFHSNNEKVLDANLFTELSISDNKKNQNTAQVENSFSTQSILYSLSNEPW